MSSITQAVWSSLPVAGLILGPDDRITEVNIAAEGFLNLSARALLGHRLADKVVIDAPLEYAFDRVRQHGAALALHHVNVGSTHHNPTPCDMQLSPLIGTPGHVLMLIHPREIADRLGSAHSSKTAAKSAIGMAEMLAHEIKNPLAGITGAAQLLSMNLSPEDVELTDLIVAESRRIVKLLDQVEQFGNLRPPVCAAVNLHDILDRARKSATLGFAAHMTIVEDFDPSLPPTWADADQLVQVMLNLLRNAAQVAQDGGQITLRTFYDMSLRVPHQDGSRHAVPLQVEIIDDGPGIPKEIAAHIFDPFVSGRENGTGLGLALVSKIITDHGGWIAVSSVPGRTAIRLSLPRAPQPKKGM